MKHLHPMLMAAQVGDIEVFKWLRNNGMKWHPSTYTVAKKFLHFDIAEWALKNGCPKDEHSRGKISLTSAIRLELSVYVQEEEETLQEEEENEEEEQEDEEEEVMVIEDQEDAVV
jgi:hypothetical protein